MPKHKAFKSFIGSHIDNEKNEELRGTKEEIEREVQKIIKTLNSEDNDDKESLVILIEDFHNHYLSLYKSYDHLTKELTKKAHSNGKDSSSSSSDSSDSDDSSPKRKVKKNGKVQKLLKNNTAGIKKDLEMARVEVDDLKRNLTIALGENEDAHRIIMGLNVEAQNWSDEKSRLLNENAVLSAELEALKGENFTFKEKLVSAENEITKLNQMQETTEEQNRILSANIALLENEIQQAETKIQDLLCESNQLCEKVSEKDRELLNHEIHKEAELAHLQDLEMELDVLRSQRQELLELKDKEISGLLKKLGDQEADSLNKVNHLTEEINSIQLEVESLRNHKSSLEELILQNGNEASVEVESLKEMLANQNSDIQKNAEERENLLSQVQHIELELDSIRKSKDEADVILDKNSGDISEFSARIEKLKEDLSSKTIDTERLLEENRNLALKTNDLRVELDILLNRERELEEGIRSKTDEGNVVKEENRELREMVSSLEIKLRKCEDDLKLLEKKNEEMAKDFQKDIDSKNQEIYLLEENIEDLNRELEMKVDEISTMVENMRTTEVKQRLTTQKLRITEQLLNQSEDSNLVKVVKLQEDKKELEGRIATLSETIATYRTNQKQMVAEIKEKVLATLTGIDTLSMKFEEDYGHLDSRTFDIVNELQVARSWIRETNVEMDVLKNEIASLVRKLEDRKEREVVLRGEIQELVTVVEMGENDRKRLTLTIKEQDEKLEQLEKNVEEKNERMGEVEKMMIEKDNGISTLSEEKREAIRQLCIWIDYHQKRFDDLKDVILKSRGVRRQRAA